MALKDWKKIKGFLVWDNRDEDGVRIEIYNGKITKYDPDNAETLKQFKNDSQALAFAKKYMRSH